MAQQSIFDPKDLSFESKRTSLVAFLDSKPDGQAWRDYLRQASSGAIIIDMIAALGNFQDYHTVVGRREAYLFAARKRSSVVAIAQTLGYSALRGTKAHYTFDFIADQTTTLKKFTSLGTIKAKDIILLADLDVTSGTAYQVTVVVGDLFTEDVVVPSGSSRVRASTSTPAPASRTCTPSWPARASSPCAPSAAET